MAEMKLEPKMSAAASLLYLFFRREQQRKFQLPCHEPAGLSPMAPDPASCKMLVAVSTLPDDQAPADDITHGWSKPFTLHGVPSHSQHGSASPGTLNIPSGWL